MQTVRFGCCSDVVFVFNEAQIPLREWISICLILDLERQQYKLQVDAASRAALPVALETQSSWIKGGGFLMFGQDQDAFGGGRTEARQSFHGIMMDILLTERILSSKAVDAYMSCNLNHEELFSHIIDVQSDSVEYREETELVYIKENPCSKGKPHYIVFPEIRTFSNAVSLCAKFGGIVSIPTTEEDDYLFYTLGLESCQTTGLWIGALNTNGIWLHYKNKQQLMYTNWIKNQTFNPSASNAVLHLTDKLRNKKGKWKMVSPLQKFCFICEFMKTVEIHVKGLCRSSAFDSTYFVSPIVNSKLSFTGIEKSKIVWIPDSQMLAYKTGFWKMISLRDPELFSTAKTTFNVDYFFGIQKWTSSEKLCSSTKETLRTSLCNSSMFTCNDGQCIPTSERCDKELDCDDQSDEEDCRLINQFSDYNPLLFPPVHSNSVPSVIYVDVDIKFVKEVDVENFMLKFYMEITRKWRDSRLIYRNLKEDAFSNDVEEGKESGIWYPYLDFYGSDDISAHVRNHAEFLSVVKASGPISSNRDTPDEGMWYDGSENDLVLMIGYTVEVMCYFDLSHYPFDIQICPFSIAVDQYAKKIMVMRIQNVNYQQTKKLRDYDLMEIKQMNISMDERSGSKLTFTFKNQSSYFIAMAFLPTSLVLFISCLAFFLQIQNFKTRITISVNSLLVLTSLFSHAAHGLPKTSYMKLIDIWFTGSISANFLVFIMLVVVEVERLRHESLAVSTKSKNLHPEVKLNAYFKYLCPIFIIFLHVIFIMHCISLK